MVTPLLQGSLSVVGRQPISFLSVLSCTDADFCIQILIFQHFSRSTRLAFLCTAPISKIQSKIVTNFAKLNIEYSIETSQFCRENCYFSPKSRWNFVGISRTCSKISKLTEDCRKLAKFWEILVKIPELVEKFNRKLKNSIRSLLTPRRQLRAEGSWPRLLVLPAG